MKKIVIVLISLTLILLVVLLLVFKGKENKEIVPRSDYGSKLVSIVNSANKDRKNYLISPYSIEMALRMLSEGTDTSTFDEIDKLIGKRDMPVFSSENRISVANALFLRDIYKGKVNNTFIKKLKEKYDAEVLIDAYKTPDKINNWVNDKTYRMIPKVADEIDEDFVLGLANAIAIDVRWASPFECGRTTPYEFNDGKNTYDVEMMHNDYNYIKYLDNKDLKGVILPYSVYDSEGNITNDEDEIALEFVALLPNDIDKFMEEFSIGEFNNITSKFKTVGEKEEVNLSLPRFKYDYSLDLKSVLKSLGVEEIFTNHADFTKVFGQIGDLYISDAIHKTHIELNENGTKAAAATYFGMKATAMPDEKEKIDITFDKPFLYAIRDVKDKELLFVGVVYNPNVWKGATCEGGN